MNAHPHTTVLTEKEYSKLSKDAKEKVARQFQEDRIQIEMVGLIALTHGDQVTLGIEIKNPWGEEVRASLGFSPTSHPHITTSFMWRSKYERELEPLVGRLLGRVDIYFEDWSKLGGDVYKVWKGGAKAVEGASEFWDKAVEATSGFKKALEGAYGFREMNVERASEGVSEGAELMGE